MEKKTEQRINRAGLFFGSAAYTFTHMPMIAVRELKKEIRENKNRKQRAAAFKGLELMKKYCDELIAEGRMTDEEKYNIIVTTFGEILSMDK